jgi:hypothetical protein
MANRSAGKGRTIGFETLALEERSSPPRNILDAFCDRGVECGGYEIECAASAPRDGSAGTTACSAVLTPMDYTACREEVDEEREDITRCLGLFNDEELARIDACITAMVHAPCRTQAELDAYAERLAAGDYDAEFVRPPPECDGTEDLLALCFD